MSDASVTRPGLGLTSKWTTGDTWGTKTNANFDKLDWAVMPHVKDKDLATPPGGPTDGDAYIVAAAPTGAWTGHAKDVARWIDGAWVFYTPKEGHLLWIDDENLIYVYDGSSWLSYAPAGGGGGGGAPGGQTRYKEWIASAFSGTVTERGGAGSTFTVTTYSGTADDENGLQFVCPGDFNALTKFSIVICDTTTGTGNSVWRLSIKDLGAAGADLSAAYSTSFAEVTIAAPGTNQKEGEADFPAGGLPTLVAGHRYKMELQRRASSDAADTCTTALGFVLLTMQYTN